MKHVLGLFLATTLVFLPVHGLKAQDAREILGNILGQIVVNEINRGKSQSRQSKHTGSPKNANAAQEPFMNRAARQQVQAALNLLGFDAGVEDGVLGYGSRAAIRRYQSSYGYTATGYLTAAQLRELRGTYNQALQQNNPNLSRPLTVNDFKKLQIALKSLGYYTGAIDGIAGRGTANAIAQYLSDRGKNANVVSTAAALDMALAETGSGIQPESQALEGAPVLEAREFPTQDGRELIDYVQTNTVESRSLVKFALSARPDLLDDPAILAKLYDRWNDAYSKPGDVSEQAYAEFREKLISEIADFKQQGPLKVVFRYLTSVELSRNAARDPNEILTWPIFKTETYGFNQFPLIDLNDLGLPKLAIEYPDEAVLNDVKMTQQSANERINKYRDDQITGHIEVFATIKDVQYSLARNQFKANIEFEGSRFITLQGEVLAERFPRGSGLAGDDAQGAPTGYLEIIKRMPELAKVVDGYFDGDSGPNYQNPGGIFGVYTGLALLDQKPEILDNDTFATSFAPRLLTINELKRYLRGYGESGGYGLNPFEQRELADRMRTEFGSVLADRAFSGPYKFYISRPAVIGEYDFDANAFEFTVDRSRVVELGVSDNVVAEFDYTTPLPTSLPMAVDEARALASKLEMGAESARVYLMIQAEADKMEIPKITDEDIVASVDQYSQSAVAGRFKLSSRVTGLRIYADEQLTQLVYEFPSSAFRTSPAVSPEPKQGMTALDVIDLPLADRFALVAMARKVPGGQALPDKVSSSVGPVDADMAEADPDVGAWFNVEARFAPVDEKPGTYMLQEPAAGYPLDLDASDSWGLIFRWTLVNADLPIVFDPAVVERRQGNLFPMEMSTGTFKPTRVWLRMRPVSVNQQKTGSNPEYTIAMVAYEILEYYVLAGDLDKMEMPEILVHGVLDDEGGATRPIAIESGAIAASQPFTSDLFPMIALQENGGAAALGDGALDWLMVNRWFIDKGVVPGLPGRAFSDLTNLPLGALLPKAREEMLTYLNGFEYTAPESIKMLATLPDRRSYFVDAPCNSLAVGRQNFEAYYDAPKGAVEARQEALLRQAGLPNIAEIDAAYKTAGERGSFQAPIAAPVALLSPSAVSAAQCESGDWSYEDSQFVNEILGADWSDIDELLTEQGRMPIVMVAAENFPAALWTNDGGFNALRFDAEVVDIQTLPGPGLFPDILVVVRAAQYEKVDIQKGDKAGDFTLVSQGAISPEDMVETPASMPDGSALDVLGLTLDMSVAEADKVLRDRFGNVTVLRSADPSAGMSPFKDAWVYLKPDLSERVTLFVESSTGDEQILGIERVLNLHDYAYPLQAVRKRAIEKYGEPVADSSGSQSLLLEWGDRLLDRNNNRSTCLAYVSTRRDLFQALKDENGNPTSWSDKYNWNQIRDTYIPWVPTLPNFTPTARVYEECGKYLALYYDDIGLVTFLVDLKAYERALLAPPAAAISAIDATEPEIKIDF